ncbi:LVIVD repeat-containing protein [Actinocorallia herbida]|uniref:LVIVD repeat-containing protein n=1 Tax=Actinocorallia herbida TaxID=58109 RepID=A0A3N1CWK4_9ACTN|nr:hypothetical protein [Actinocorallia herbida]ROO85673.1 LVIVD repeat-containing protein [Actinocorallia herbida]
MASRVLHRPTFSLVTALLAALALVLGGAPASADPVIPGVDEAVSSPDLKHLANLPKQGAFASPTAYNSDLAFKGDLAFAGNYNGFTVYDIDKAAAPTIVSQVLCPGSQNDISVTGNLLFLSTDSSRSDDSCQSVAKPVTDPTAWEGIKIFDISDPANPRYVKSVETKCGSHTHTLVPSKSRKTVYLYVSSYLTSAASVGADCTYPHDKISVIKVPVKDPTAAALVAEPVLFSDGGNPGDGLAYPETTYATTGCHDLTVYPDKDLMAGACMGDGALFDISDREYPRLITAVRDDVNFSFWHSATFNNKADKVVFTDELGGGGTATCNETIGSSKGADAIYDIVGKGDRRKLVFRSYFKIPRANADTENCVAHNGNLIPVKGRDIMVQAWYQGGISVWDFTNSRKPKELAYFERGPLSATSLVLGGSWSAYYYNGHIFSNDIQKGFDVLDVTDPLTKHADRYEYRQLNPQTQYDLF